MRLPEASRSAIGLLRVLLACSVLIPACVFAIASWLSFQAAFADAKNDLMRITEVAREHAAKLFDSQSQVADRVNDLVAGMDVPTIKRSEKSLHDAFAWIVARLPQVQSVLLADRDGEPLVSAGTYPVPPNVSVRDRDYFHAIITGYSGTYVSSLQVGDVNRRLFFGLSRPWLAPDGALNGVIDVAVLPAFFEDFYEALAGEGPGGGQGKVLTLVRDDGQLLVRYPPIKGAPPRASTTSEFFKAITAEPDQGTYEGTSIVDGRAPVREFAYQRVHGYPVYVVAGRNRSIIVAGWRHEMLGQLFFALPATVALFAVTWVALVRTRREADALARARQEIALRETAEDALLKSQRLEAVGQMTGGVAHDFNNLLTVILGSAEMLLRRPDDQARVRRLTGQIVLAAKRGGEITQQLLAFSRRQVVKPQTLDLNKRLRDFKPLLDRAAGEAVRVEFDLGAGLGAVRLDPGHFEAAILNLVGNARDAMPLGGRVLITTRNVSLPDAGTPELPPGAYVRIAVSDTGTGMDPETAARAFEPFFTTKDVGKGTGLGLSQVYGFAKQAVGDVRIISAPDKGTTVELLLPRTERTPLTEQFSGGSLPLRQASAGEVVLVVEDEPGVREMTVESLQELGYATMTAATAQAALDCLRHSDRVDVLFSDVVMPGGMNGLQLSVEARRLRPDLKVLLTSGYTYNFDQEHPRDIPLLTKPYDRGQLAQQLRAVLQG